MARRQYYTVRFQPGSTHTKVKLAEGGYIHTIIEPPAPGRGHHGHGPIANVDDLNILRDALLEYRVHNQGASKDDIRALFPQYNDTQISNLLTRARRNNFIFNRGTRAKPMWKAVL